MQPQPFTATPTSAKKPGPSLGLSIALLIAGVAIAIPCAIAAFAPIVRTFTKSPVLTPVNETKHYGKGEYLVYERTSNAFSGTLTPNDVKVTSSGGEPVDIGFPTDEEHITNNGKRYLGVVRFTIHKGGEYTVHITADSVHEVIITRSIIDSVKHALIYFAGMGVGVLLAIAGVIMIIVGSVRRGRAQRLAYAYAASASVPATPAGWYPDVNLPGTQRWWDGTRWTEHTHPPQGGQPQPPTPTA